MTGGDKRLSVGVYEECGCLRVEGVGVTLVGGEGGELRAGGRMVHHDTTCVAATHAPCVISEVGGVRGHGLQLV